MNDDKMIVKCSKGYEITTTGNEIHRVEDGCRDLCISYPDDCCKKYRDVCEYLRFKDVD